MERISYEELSKKWTKSKEKINYLLKIKDVSTINMLKLYKLHINSPYNITLRNLFEISFNGWYNINMKE